MQKKEYTYYSGTTELGSVQLVLKFLGMFW